MSFHYDNYRYANSGLSSPLPFANGPAQANEQQHQTGTFDGREVMKHPSLTILAPKAHWPHHLLVNEKEFEYSDSDSEADSEFLAFTSRNTPIAHPYIEYSHGQNDNTAIEFEQMRMLD